MGEEELSLLTSRRTSILLLALAGCGTDEPLPNVILISIDSLRPDHLGCYGHAAPTSPNIDALARQGTRFDRAHSSTTWTLPAHLSLLTGLPDSLHGVVWDRVPLDSQRKLLAEQFQAAGYATAGFYGGPYLHESFGFGRGFDRYVNCGAQPMRNIHQPAEVALREFEQESHRVRTADRIEQAAERFLDKQSERPFFLFLHHWDVHYDFNAPDEYVEQFAGDYSGQLSMRDFIRNPEINPEMAPADREYLLACYDAEIRWVDHQIGRLLRKLSELEIEQRTYLVITSDHGEQFFEHGRKGHRLDLYDETLRIPLVVRGPGIQAGNVVQHQARIFDVMPTLLDLTGLPEVPDVYGVSLRPLLEGRDPPGLRRLPIVAELTTVSTEGPAEYVRHRAVGRSGKKLIQATRLSYDRSQPIRFSGLALAAPLRGLFDLGVDPGEQRDLSRHAPDLLAELAGFLDRVDQGLDLKRGSLRTGVGPAARQLDPDVDRMLRENGYLK